MFHAVSMIYVLTFLLFDLLVSLERNSYFQKRECARSIHRESTSQVLAKCDNAWIQTSHAKASQAAQSSFCPLLTYSAKGVTVKQRYPGERKIWPSWHDPWPRA